MGNDKSRSAIHFNAIENDLNDSLMIGQFKKFQYKY